MIDISSTGSTIQINTRCTGKFEISRFSDEGTPFEFNEIEVTGSAPTLNGELITWSKPVAYAAAVTVVPGTPEDVNLRKLLMKSRVNYAGGNVTAVDPHQVEVRMVVNIPVISIENSTRQGQQYNHYVFVNGRIVSGPTAPSSNPEGKLSARTYTFVFEQMTTAGASTQNSIG